MASRKSSKRGKGSRGKKYHGSRSTVRGHQRSTSGIIYPPLDVRSPNDLTGILKRITKGPITIVLVYADWCGHCHTLMPHFKKASNLPNRNAQVISVRDDMVEQYNNTVNSKINSKAPKLDVEGYPSVLLVGPNGTKLSEIASTKEAVESAMTSVAPVAVEAGLSKAESITSNNTRNTRNSVNQNLLLKEVGVENTGLASKGFSNRNLSTKVSSNQSFEHLNMKANANRNRNRIMNEVVEEVEEAEEEVEEAEEEAEEEVEEAEEEVEEAEDTKEEVGEDVGVATSLSVKPAIISPVKLSNTKLNIPASAITKHEADSIVSLQSVLPAPVSPPDSKLALRSIQNITGANRLKGGAHGYGHGGSLYGIMSQTAYKLAPAAVLLATAATVMNKTRRAKRNINYKKQKHTKRKHHRK
jgi:thiol-disulfide isomerase/thioredoxin